MKKRLTTLNAGDHFELNGIVFKKLENREHGNRCLNLSTDGIERYPLMLYVDKVDEPTPPKPKRQKKEKKTEDFDVVTGEATINLDLGDKDLDEQEPLSDSV